MKTDTFFSLLDELLAKGGADLGASYRLPLAAYYDSIPVDDEELAMNLRFAGATTGDVLELAVGTGRVAIPLAQTGHRVTGLDLAPDMLKLCRAKAEMAGVIDHLELVEGDMTDFDLGRRFELILIPNGSIIYLDSVQRAALFRCVAAHLAEGGRFVFSALAGEVPAAYGPFVSLALHRPEQGVLFTQLVAMRRVSSNCQQVGALCTEVLQGKARVWVTRDCEHTLTPGQVEAELNAAGLRLTAVHSDFGCTDYDEASEEIIAVASLANTDLRL